MNALPEKGAIGSPNLRQCKLQIPQGLKEKVKKQLGAKATYIYICTLVSVTYTLMLYMCADMIYYTIRCDISYGVKYICRMQVNIHGEKP